MPTKKNQTRIDKIIAYFTKDKPNMVLLKNLLGKKRRVYHSTLIEFGTTSDEQRLWLFLADMGSLLIAGEMGSGKTTFLKAIIGALSFRNTSKQIKYIIATPKPADYKILLGSPYLTKSIISNPKKLLSQVLALKEDVEHRYKLLAESGSHNLFWYNRNSKKAKLEYKVLIIDNYSSVIKSLTTSQQKLLNNTLIYIVTMARPTGIHLILSTQNASAKSISGLLNVNFTNRLAFKTETKKDSRDIHFDSGCENLLGKGDAILSYHNNGGVLHRIQTPYISDVELKKLIQ